MGNVVAWKMLGSLEIMLHLHLHGSAPRPEGGEACQGDGEVSTEHIGGWSHVYEMCLLV
jgi:hypothetical protein